MPDTEITDIEAAAQALVRQAYDLGRSHALRKVVDVLNADRPGSEQLALMAPPAPEVPAETPVVTHQELTDVETTRAKAPWWAWRVR